MPGQYQWKDLARPGSLHVPVIYPRSFLALLATVFGPTAAPAFGKLPREFFPLPAFVVSALSDPALRVVFSAQVPHHDASPILHILGMMSDGELFDQWKNVKVVWLQIFFILIFIDFFHCVGCAIESPKLAIDLQARY